MKEGISQTNFPLHLGMAQHSRAFANKRILMFMLVALFGIIVGAFLTFAGGLPYKWVFTITVAGCFPILMIAMGSLKRALQALLIFSLSMNMGVHIGYSDKYLNVDPGIPINLPILILLALYAFWLTGIVLKRTSIRFFSSITIPFGILTLWAGSSLLVATKSSYVLLGLPNFITAFLLYFYAANFIKSEEDIRFVSRLIAIAVLFSSILGIIQYAAGTDFNLTFLGGREDQVNLAYQAESISRVSGLLVWPNTFAFFLNGVLPLMLIFTFMVRGFTFYLCSVSFILGLIALVLTYSRGGWLAFAVSLLVMTIFAPRRKWRNSFRGLSTGILALTLAIIILIVPLSSQILARLTKDDYGAAHSRISLAEMGIRIIMSHPITGVGVGNYQFASSPVLDIDGKPIIDLSDGLPPRVHNIFLYTTAELGLPALCLFVWILVAFFTKGISAVRVPTGLTGLFALGLVGGLAGMLAHAMVEPVTLAESKYLILLFIAGCLTGLNGMKPTQ